MLDNENVNCNHKQRDIRLKDKKNDVRSGIRVQSMCIAPGSPVLRT